MKPRPAMLAAPHPVVEDAYARGFQDGVAETIAQLRMRFDVGLIPEMREWLREVTDGMENGQ